MMKKKIALFALLAFVALALVTLLPEGVVRAEKKSPEDAALARTRKKVEMLDDMYKSTIVLITKHYVNDESDLAAGEAFQAMFKAMNDKGWHEVRLLDATGQPIEDRNAPRAGFEKEAVKGLKSGEAWHEEVIEKDGKRYLRAATPIPVVLEKCIICHDHYKDAKKGEAIGAISYTIEIE